MGAPGINRLNGGEANLMGVSRLPTRFDAGGQLVF